MAGMSVAVELSGVPETMLWTLFQRAEEARCRDAVSRCGLLAALQRLAPALLHRIFALRFQ
jgi:hypothetical protein